MKLILSLVGMAAVWGFTLPATAEDWPQWRGPDRNGIGREPGWFKGWSASGPKQLWKARVGAGFSSVVVADGKLVTLGHAEKQERIQCLDAATGRELWNHAYPDTFVPQYYEGGSSGTPVIADGRVYALGNMGDLTCLTLADGKVVWHHNLVKDLGLKVPDWGFAGAPLVENGLVIVNAGGAGAAYDAATGKPVWQSNKDAAGYAAPTPFTSGGKRAVAIFGGRELTAVDPASGAKLWSTRWKTQYDVNAADPIFSGSRVFLSSGYGTGAGLFDFSSGEPVSVWKRKEIETQFSSAVLIDGHLYAVSGNTGGKGQLMCVSFATGETKWSSPVGKMGSLIAADGHLIVLTEQGELRIVAAEPAAYRELARAQVIGGKNWTSPVLAKGRIYCRNSKGELVCLEATRQ